MKRLKDFVGQPVQQVHLALRRAGYDRVLVVEHSEDFPEFIENGTVLIVLKENSGEVVNCFFVG